MKKSRYMSLLSVIPMLGFSSCILIEPSHPSDDHHQDKPSPSNKFEHDGLVSVDEVWKAGSHYIDSYLTIEGKVTIEAGATIYMGYGAFIEVRDGGSIITNGTSTNEVRFTSQKEFPLPGDWGYISIVESADNQSSFNNTVFEYGGNNHTAMMYVNNKVKFNHVTFAASAYEAINIDSEKAKFESSDLFFSDMGSADLFYVTSPDYIGEIPQFTADDISHGAIKSNSGSVSLPAFWGPFSAPIYLGEWTSIDSDRELTVTAQDVEILMPANAYIDVINASFNMNGVRMENAVPGTFWDYIAYHKSVPSSVRNSTFINGSKDGGSGSEGNQGYFWLDESSNVTFENITINDSHLKTTCYYTNYSSNDSIETQSANLYKARKCNHD